MEGSSSSRRTVWEKKLKKSGDTSRSSSRTGERNLSYLSAKASGPTYGILGPGEELEGGSQAGLVVLGDPCVPQAKGGMLHPTEAKETSHCQRFGVETIDEHCDHLWPGATG